MSQNTVIRPMLLCILDGFGYREAALDNAISVASLPNWEKMWETCPHALLEASGEAVGLPKGQVGNSEVGHMNLGAGRVVLQVLPLIDSTIASGDLAGKQELSDFIAKLKESKGTCHLMGLASPGGVHAHQLHIVELARLVAGAGVPVAVHAFLDGRDVPPDSAAEQITWLSAELDKISGAQLVTLCGRYYAMDRDKRWERVLKAYDLLLTGEGAPTSDAVEAIKASYANDVYDEFVLPHTIRSYNGMCDGDGILFANFRSDRARQILSALLDPSFDAFARKKTVCFAAALGMVDYADYLTPLMTSLFPSKQIKNNLGEVVSKAGLMQLRIAETEKYPHVTFFFNGGQEEPYPREERIMVLSPKVATYDLQPEMSAPEVTDNVVRSIEAGIFNLIVLNFANADMVGHTGSLQAAVKAVEAVDLCLGRVTKAIEKAGGVALITADHGNCEKMLDPETNGPHTAHTLSKVPLVVFGKTGKLRDGKLADVAPTILKIMGLAKPEEMDGENLFVQ
ncbi:MAG TPA: 2,3-bisphosphoglycerate-independent phosphoglycerate mutase [Rhodospirillaceae bacterium]|nr:2,3-bisphosphoglycerate-independent phosphoglycerate mutase [Rhodospirillaceae bacterium]